MKKILVPIIIIVLLLLNFTLLYKFNNIQNRLDIFNSKYNVCLNKNDILKDSELKNLRIEYNEFKYQDYNIVNGLSIFKTIKNKPIVFVRFFEFGCHECLDSLLSSTHRLASYVGSKNIVIIGDYNSERNLYVILKQNQLDNIRYLNITDRILPLDKNLEPYIFVINSTEHICSFFIPNKNDLRRSIQYFSLIREKYFD